MFKLIILILFACLAVWLGIHVTKDPGYLLISYNNWTIETSIWIGLLAVFLIILVFLAFNHIILRIGAGTNWFKRYKIQKKINLAHDLSEKGFASFLQNDWPAAERYFQQAANQNYMPQIHFLCAAIACSKTKSVEQVDLYLNAAERLTSHDVITELTAAKINIEHQAYIAAIEILEELIINHPNHYGIMETYLEVLLLDNHYEKIEALVPKFIKLGIITKARGEHLILMRYEEEAQHLRNINAPEEDWHDYFNQIPKSHRTNPELLYLTISERLRFIGQKDTEQVVRQALSKNWHEKLISSYGLIDYDAKSQLQFCETMAKTQPESSGLQLCQARLCVKLELWGKAEHFYKTAIANSPSAELYFELANLCKSDNREQDSRKYFEEGLSFVTKSSEANKDE